MITETKLRRVEPDIMVFTISGRLSLGNSLISVENSMQQMVHAGARKIVVDLAGLTAIDSSGIGLLVTSSGHIEQNGGRMRIAGAQGAVAKALGLVHIDRITPVDADVEASCRHFAADGASA